jgi:hypothetical protein
METPQPNAGPPPSGATPEIDQLKLQMMMQQIRDNQNLSLAIVGGAVAAAAGAVLWAIVTAVTNWQIGIMAVGIGFLVGLVIRKVGRGVSPSFGITGAVLSLAGCLLGNLLAACAIIADQQSMGFFEVLGRVDFRTAVDIIVETFHPMDVLFYGLAVYYGYKYSFHQLTPDELASLARK